MTRRALVFTTTVAAAVLCATRAGAQIQYYGYAVGDPSSIAGLEKYTNFAEVGFDYRLAPEDPGHTAVLAAVVNRGLKLVINIGGVIWDPNASTGPFTQRYPDWQDRFMRYLNANRYYVNQAIAFAHHDEPFNGATNMQQFDEVSTWIRSQIPAGIKTWVVIAGPSVGNSYWYAYGGSLPNIDWIGIDWYGKHPNGGTFQNAMSSLKWRFPGKKTLYVIDGYWNQEHTLPDWYGAGATEDVLATVAQEYYDVARADPDAILLGIFAWDFADGTAPRPSNALGCTVRAAHSRIGRQVLGRFGLTGRVYGFDASACLGGYAGMTASNECEVPTVEPCGQTWCSFASVDSWAYQDWATGAWVHNFRWCPGTSVQGTPIYTYAVDPTGRSSTLLPTQCRDNPACVLYPNTRQPIGYLDGIDPSGYAWGWTCDPDAPSVSTDVVFYVDSPWGQQSIGPYRTNLGSEPAVANLCGGGNVHRFGVYLPYWTKGYPVRAYGLDLVSGSANLPGWQCAATWPACVW